MATLHIDKIIAEKVNQDDLIRLLETVIDDEMQRPEAEMNCDLIDQCVDALLEMRQDRDHLAVMVPLMQDKAFLHLMQRKAGNTARLNGAARGALIAAAILASTISVNAMVDAAFDYNILEHIGKAISASVLGPEIIGGEDDVDEPTTVPGTTEKSESTTVPERTTANGETATRQPEQTTTAAAVTQTTTTPTTTEREQESTTKKEPTTKKVTGDNVHHKPTQPDRPEETTKAVRVIGFNAQLGESFKSHYILCKAGAYITAYRGTAKELICNVVDGNRIFAIADEVFRKHTELTTVELPYVTYVGAKAFAGCTALTQAELPKLQQLGEEAFAGCKALAEAETGDSLTHIGRRAFAETALQRLRLGKGVTVIPEGLCNDCTHLESVRLQGQVTEIGSWAFEGCGRLKTVTGTEHLRRVGDYAFSDCQAVTFAFPAQLEVAGENAFYFCRQLQIGALPQSIKSIGKRAFAYCPGLTEVRLPAGIAVVPEEAFRATNAKTIVLPEGVERIEAGAFESCKATAITVPGTVKYIGKRALYSVLLRDVRFNCLSPVMEDQALYNSNRLVVQCYLGTTPYQYAKANQIKVELKQDLPEVIPGTDD